MSALPPDRAGILSEQRHPDTHDLHQLDPATLLERLHQVDQEVLPAVAQAMPALTAFVTDAIPRFTAGGRLIYLGAGTSGRLGVLDASECPPTFQCPPERVIGIIAGGDSALRRSSEGAEDNPQGAIAVLSTLQLNDHDTVLGIAAGGTTPYVRGALTWCAALPKAPLTGLLSCAPVVAPDGCAHLIVAPTGPEAITGSTRLKAGTATKLILNRLSNALMIADGRVLGNLMIDLRASNDKLRDRAARIIQCVCAVDRTQAFALLDAHQGSARAAIQAWRSANSGAGTT